MSQSMRLTFLVVINAALACGGCMTTKPPNDLGYADVPTLAAFAGCYKNAAEDAKGSGSHFLSRTIWPNEKLSHEKLEAIRVRFVEGGTLHFSAISAGQVVQEETFVEGRDFSFRSGRITMSRFIGSAATEPGNPFIGMGFETQTLGVDAFGNGRRENSVAFAGTVFLVIPIAASVKDASRFVKRDSLCLGDQS